MTNALFNFKNPQEAGPSAVMLAAVVILAGSLAYMLLVPKPTVAGLVKAKQRNLVQLEKQIKGSQASGEQARAKTAARLWQGDPDTITATVLAQLTKEALGHKLKLSAFRPQRLVGLTELTELPFSVQISGSYPAVHAFAAALDRPNSKLALRSLQLASSDATSDAVTATLGLCAYVPGQLVSTKTTSKGGTSRG